MPIWLFIRDQLFARPAVDQPAIRWPLYGRLSILILSFEWILFGSLHFLAPEQTLKEVPDWSFLDGPLVVAVTGFLSVTTGILILIPTTRRLAALMSLGLLTLFIPAIFHILSDSSALPNLPAPWPTLFRIVLLPNNIYLAYLSIYAWRHPSRP
jgi:uncharacterized membrane protein